MLGCDLLGHGASNPNLCLGTQVGSPDSPRSESQVQLLTATYTNKRAHPLLVGSGGTCPVLHTQEAWAPVDPVGWLPRDLAHKPGALGSRRPDTLTEELRGQERWPWVPRARPATGNATGPLGDTPLAPPTTGQKSLCPSPQEVGGGEDRHPSSDGGETETQVGLLMEEPRLTSPSPPSAPPAVPRPAPRAALPSL